MTRSRLKGFKEKIIKRAVDLANAKSASHANRTGMVFRNIGFIGDGDTEAAIAIEDGFPGGLTLDGVVSLGTRTVVSVETRGDGNTNNEERPMKVSVSGGSNVAGGHTGISVPNGSDAEIAVTDGSNVTGGVYGINERDAAIDELQKVLPHGIPKDAIEDAFDAVRRMKDGTHEQQETAVRESRLWEWIKEYGPDMVGLAAKTALALAS
ncbi:hypothetical protein [Burkholderia cenocepacia]|uniref:hypothetical protein n=1 Tax=Burkholderia cenocepacia TaxID=95486 RepID=UPI000F566D2C|nr:hypothetical protein [Burkholderia cenocepacia]